MTKELPTHHHFKSKLGVDANVKFVYPWLPDKCSICSKCGHLHKACRSKVKILTKDKAITKDSELATSKNETEKVRTRNTNEEVDIGDSMENTGVILKAPTTADRNSCVERTKDHNLDHFHTQEASSGIKTVESDAEHGSESTSDKVEETKENNVKENTEWSNVSPSKIGRSRSKEIIPEPIVSSPSRFAVISVEEDQLEVVDDNGNKVDDNETEEGEIPPEVDDEVVDDNEVNSNDTHQQDIVDKRERRLNPKHWWKKDSS
ncbi:hypothetical protein Bca4012_062578 [Brassica carinata]